MTLSTQTSRIEYTANGSQATFNYSFEIFQTSDMKVYKDGVLQTSGYSVTGVGNDNGGTVVFSTAPASGVVVRLARVTAKVQELVLREFQKIPVAAVEKNFDKIVAMIQELAQSDSDINIELDGLQIQLDDLLAFLQSITLQPSAQYVGETQPEFGFQGMRWYNPSAPATYVFYYDGDSGQWVQEAHEGVDGALRSEIVTPVATFNSVADASSALGLVVGKYVEVLDYYGGANRNNSGKMLFEVVANGTGTVDGGSIIQGVGCRLRQIFTNGAPRVKQFGARACSLNGVGFDSFSAFQAALNYSTAVLVDYEPNGYLIGDSINITHRANGVDIIGVGAGIFGAYTTIYGNTGAFPIFDCVGSQKVRLKSIQLKSATANTSPSQLGILLARSATAGYDYAQFCVLEDCLINLADAPSAFGGKGSIGIYNQAAEICTFRDTYSIANNGLVITNVNFGGVASKYRTLNSSITSTSDFKFEGSCTLTSIGNIGAPLYTQGAQSMHGQVYLNGGYGRTVDTRNACGVVLDGISQGHCMTFFVEFSPHWAWYGGTLKDCELRFQGSIQDTRYVVADPSVFTSMRDVDITILNSLSSPVSLPPYHIKNKSSDTIKNVQVYSPADPTTDWVVCSNTQFNRINSCYYGNNIRVMDVTDLASDVIYVRDPTTRTRIGKIIGCAGSPEGVVTANVGTLCISSDNGNIYRKSTGSGNTGWVAM